MHDVVRFSIISHAELLGLIVRETVGGSTADDVAGKYIGALTGAAGSNSLALSGEQVRTG